MANHLQMGCAVVLVLFASPCYSAVDREMLVQRLRHQQDLVQTVRAKYTLKVEGTASRMVPAIKKARELLGQTDFRNYVYSKEDAEARYRRVQWWRSGVKERQEESGGILSAGETTTAFDGAIVRTFNNAANRGSIDTVDTSHWVAQNRLQPYSFLYHYQDKSYSDLIERSSNVSIRELGTSGNVECSFDHPDLSSRFVLLFDNELRLLQRDRFRPEYAVDRLRQRQEFHNYKRFELPSGESIWFPMKCIYRYFAGTLKDGTHAEYKHTTIDIESISFNTPIPDKMFTLQYPQSAIVRDNVNGFGEIPASELPPAELEPSGYPYVWLALLGLGGVAIGGAAVLWYSKRM